MSAIVMVLFSYAIFIARKTFYLNILIISRLQLIHISESSEISFNFYSSKIIRILTITYFLLNASKMLVYHILNNLLKLFKKPKKKIKAATNNYRLTSPKKTYPDEKHLGVQISDIYKL